MPKKKIELEIKTPDQDEGKPRRHESVSSSPLFSGIGENSEEILDHVVIYRDKPIREGNLGTLAADASEEDIREQFGGGTFRVMGRTEKKKPISGAYTTVELAGDPIFTNEVSRKRWEKIKKAELGEDPKPISSDGVALEEARHQRETARIKAEADAAIARARAEAEGALARAKMEAEMRDAAEERRRQREREERRAEADEREAREEARRQRERDERVEERRLEREARERETKEQREIEERRWKAELDERRQEREARGDPMAQFAAMAQIFGALQGSQGPDDPVTALTMRLPEILEQVRETGKEIAVASSASKGTKKRDTGFDEKNDVAFKGPIANELKRAVFTMQKQGKTPEQIERALAFKFRELAGVKPPAGHLPPRRTPPKKAPPKKVTAPAAKSHEAG